MCFDMDCYSVSWVRTTVKTCYSVPSVRTKLMQSCYSVSLVMTDVVLLFSVLDQDNSEVIT